MNVRFTVEFRGEAPDPIKVGQELTISGRVWVKAIDADAVDITSWGSDTEYALGDVTIALLSNRLEVEE